MSQKRVFTTKIELREEDSYADLSCPHCGAIYNEYITIGSPAIINCACGESYVAITDTTALVKVAIIPISPTSELFGG